MKRKYSLNKRIYNTELEEQYNKIMDNAINNNKKEFCIIGRVADEYKSQFNKKGWNIKEEREECIVTIVTRK